jgi:hypothetical protein
MNKEKLNLTAEQGRDIIYKNDSDFKTIRNKIVGKKRWAIEYEIVVERISDGKFFKDAYKVGATENQDERPYEYSEPNFIEVFPVTKTYIDYE